MYESIANKRKIRLCPRGDHFENETCHFRHGHTFSERWQADGRTERHHDNSFQMGSGLNKRLEGLYHPPP